MKTLITAVLPALMIVTVACGYSSKAPTPGAMPTITQLNPASANAGGAAFTMTVNGTNFMSTAVIDWNGKAQPSGTTFVSASQLTLAVPASAIASSATVAITVTNPATSGTGQYGSGGTMAETSMPMNFTIN